MQNRNRKEFLTNIFLIAAVSMALGMMFFALNPIVSFKDPQFKYKSLGSIYKGKAFTGFTYQLRGKGFPLYKLQFFWRGKQELTEHRWYDNGSKWQEIDFTSGHRHGKHRIWYRDGQVLALKNYWRGQADGEQWGWHPNGVVSDYHTFDKGRQMAYRSFISDGKPYYNYWYSGKERIGLQGGDYCRVSAAK